MDSGPVRVRRARGFVGARSQCGDSFLTPPPFHFFLEVLSAAEGTVFHSFLWTSKIGSEFLFLADEDTRQGRCSVQDTVVKAEVSGSGVLLVSVLPRLFSVLDFLCSLNLKLLCPVRWAPGYGLGYPGFPPHCP